ncbi:hypothetical protein GQ54DRAFT_309536 [Martensiomyces pterosporus]|nr:hypothetical protein GQ54DRAFT_309536 [Martensiomyces pterosporus]
MSSRILSQSRLLVARTRSCAHLSSRYAVSQRSSSLHTTGATSRSLMKQLRTMLQSNEQKGDPLTKTDVPVVERFGSKKKQGGHRQGAGMPLYVPLKAKNAEKAWDIWGCYLRQESLRSGVAARDELVELALLLAQAGEAPTDQGLFVHASEANDATGTHAISGFRVATVLRHIFAESVRGAYCENPSEEQSAVSEAADSTKAIRIADADLRLGLTSVNDYEQLLQALYGAVECQAPSGNTLTPAALSPDELALEIGDAPVARLAHLLILASVQDGVTATPGMVQVALETAVALRDTTAARDILSLTYRDLALLLDLPLSTGATSHTTNILDDPHSETCQAAVETALRMIAVGQNPNIVDTAAFPTQPQEDITSEQLEGLVSYSADTMSPKELADVRSWRAATAENVYRALISAGIKEIPSPDQPSKPALQGSVTPSPAILINLLRIYCGADNIEQAAILYDTLVATLQPRQVAGMEHKLDWESWTRVSKAIHGTKQAWMMARFLSDVVGDGWTPSSAMYEDYLDILGDLSEEALAKAIGDIEEGVAGNGQTLELSPKAVESLVRALVSPCKHVSAKDLSLRIDQALRLVSGSIVGDCSPVSDATARAVISALVGNGQITRARQLAETWAADRPGLVSDKSVAELILGLATAGEYKQALELFASIQGSSSGDISMDILCSVLQVYVLAGDYEEAVSVGKRIRAVVKDSSSSSSSSSSDDRVQVLPGRDVYNCLVRAYCAEGMPAEALRVLEEMRAYQLHATPETYAILLNAMSNLRSLDGLKLVVALANVDYNMVAIEDDQRTERGDATSSRPLPLNTEFYNALIEAYGRIAEPIKALQVWEVMRLRGVKPDNLTATLLIDTCGWNERVHWDEDMQPQGKFVEREIPEDHIYTGMPFFHLHYLGTTLKELEQAGLQLSIANYRHLLEALIRAGFLEEALSMVIGKYETSAEKEAWTARAGKLLEPAGEYFLSGLASLLKQMAAKRGETVEPLAKFMDVSLDIPLTRETVNTVYGMIAAVRARCTTKDDPEPWEMPFVQRLSPNLIERLELHQQRLDAFLRAQRPDLLLKHRQEASSAPAEQPESPAQ